MTHGWSAGAKGKNATSSTHVKSRVLSEVLHLTCDSLKILLLTAAVIEDESDDSVIWSGSLVVMLWSSVASLSSLRCFTAVNVTVLLQSHQPHFQTEAVFSKKCNKREVWGLASWGKLYCAYQEVNAQTRKRFGVYALGERFSLVWMAPSFHLVCSSSE